MSHDPTKKPLTPSYEITVPLTPKVLEHLKALGDDIVSRYGGYGSIHVEIFRGEVTDIQINATLKSGYQF